MGIYGSSHEKNIWVIYIKYFLYDCFIVIDTHMENLSLVWWQLMYAENMHDTIPPAMENIHKVSVKNLVNRYMETTLPKTLTPDLVLSWITIQ